MLGDETLNITLDDAVLDYMDAKGKSDLTLMLRRSGGGWCGAMEFPEVELKVPAAPGEYNKYEISGITVYVNKRIKTMNSGLKFRLKKTFFLKNVVVEGVRPTGM